MRNLSLLFFGELPPNIIHGISLSNKLNIDILKENITVDIIEEKTSLKQHNKKSLSKIINIFQYSFKIFRKNKIHRYDYFYTVFSLSTFGSIKTILSLLSFSLSGSGAKVLHIHRGDFLSFYNKLFLNKLISKLIFILIDKLIVLSAGQKEEFSHFYKNENIYVLENSLNKEYIFTKNGFEGKQFIFISNYLKEKGIYELLGAFKNLENNGIDFHLDCYGSFRNEEEKKKILSFQSNKIIINGFINEKNKFKKISDADCLILPSWNEGQPTIILEAMSQGTIILTTRVGLISEILGEKYIFYFDEKNMLSLESCILKYIHYREKESLSRDLREKYKKYFSLDMHKRKLMDIIN